MAREGRFFSDPKAAAADEPKERVILVEGADDANFLDKILEEEGADPTIVGIVYTGSHTQIIPNMSNLVKSSAYVRGAVKRIAIIRDANGSPANVIANLSQQLPTLNLPAPVHGQLVQYDGAERVLGLFLIPSGTQPGALEDLLMDTVAGDARSAVSRKLLEDVQAAHGALDHPSKRWVRIYLAVCPVASSGCGLAFKRNWFDHGHGVLEPLRQFIREFIN